MNILKVLKVKSELLDGADGFKKLWLPCVQDIKYKGSVFFYENHLLILKILPKTPFRKLVLKIVKIQPRILTS